MKNIDNYIIEKLVINDDTKRVLQHRKQRKSKINKAGADWIVWADPMGDITFTTGNCTRNKLSIFDKKYSDYYIYFLGQGTPGKLRINYVLWGTKNDLKVGGEVVIVDNDTQRKTAHYGSKDIVAIIPSTKKDFDKFASENDYFTHYHNYYDVTKDGYRTKKTKWGLFHNYFYLIRGVEK